MSRPTGRPPVPHGMHVLRGTRDRHPDAPQMTPPIAIPRAPRDLGHAGRAAWRVYWRNGRVWLAETDRPLLERLCRLQNDAARLRLTIETEGLTVANPRTKRSHIHPMHNSLLGVYHAIERLEASAGFTPVDRQRLRTERAAQDPLSEWMESSG